MHELLNRILAEARGTWRFRWYGLMIAWVIAVAGCVLVYGLPNQYRSDARIHVDTQSMLQPLLKGLTVQPDLNTKVRLMTNTLLSHANLEKIAQKTDLSLQADSEEQKEAQLQSLKRQIHLKGQGNDLYALSYTSKSPRKAQDVVQTVLNILMESTLGSTQEDSASARQFLRSQVQDYRAKLQADEARLAKFKRAHIGLIPNQGGKDYYQRLDQAQQHLSDLREQLATAQHKRNALRSEIAAMKNGQTPSNAPNPRLQAIDAQIQADTQQLSALLLKYTDQHPDVIAMKQSLKRLQAQRKKVASEKNTGPAQQADLSVNPVYQQLSMNLNDVGVQIDTLKPKIVEQQKTISVLKSKVDEITNVERQLSNLNRDYSVTKDRYHDLLTRLNSAELSGDVEHSGGQINFQIIDPPSLPLNADAPHRVLLLVVVVLGSLGAGVAFAFFLHQIRPVFLTRRSLADVTGRPVLGSVSMALSHAQRRWSRGETTGFGLGVAFLLAFLGISMLFAGPGAHLVQSVVGGLSL